MPNRSALWGHPAYHHERTITISRHDLTEGVGKCMLPRQEAQAKFNEAKHKDPMMVLTPMAPKWMRRVRAAVVINHHFQDGETTCHRLSKRQPDNSTIFAAEVTAITLVLNYYRQMGPVQHDVVVYSDSISCLLAIEGKETENPFICHIMNLLWLLSNKGTRVGYQATVASTEMKEWTN